jgi:thioredoxin reductase
MAEALSADVAIIGAGPAGLGAALALRRRGVARVLVLERDRHAGGVPRHCGHPPFGMREFGRVLTGPAYARRLVDRALAAGVDIRTGHSVVAVEPGGRMLITTSDGPAAVEARRGIIATGVRESSRHARLLSGDRPLGVVTTGTLQAMVYLNDQVPFHRPVVVGTELVSLSSLLTCRKAGIQPAAMIEAASRPTTRLVLMVFPRLLGIPVHYDADLVEIRGRSRVQAVTLRSADGSVATIACDGVLLTGCFVPEAALVRASHLELDPGSGGPVIDQFGRCSDPAWFAAGNVLRPVESAGWSFQEGRRIGGWVVDDLASRLPRCESAAAIDRGRGIKLVVPQRLSLPLGRGGLAELRLRVAEPMAGELSIAADGQRIWSRRAASLPERRLLVPLDRVPVPAMTRRVEIGFGP